MGNEAKNCPLRQMGNLNKLEIEGEYSGCNPKCAWFVGGEKRCAWDYRIYSILSCLQKTKPPTKEISSERDTVYI